MLVVCSNSFDKLAESKGLGEDENELHNYRIKSKEKEENNAIYNKMAEFEKKEELYEVEMITTQALEVILEKLVLDQVKELDTWE